jgi:hypothetical protein
LQQQDQSNFSYNSKKKNFENIFFFFLKILKGVKNTVVLENGKPETILSDLVNYEFKTEVNFLNEHSIELVFFF